MRDGLEDLKSAGPLLALAGVAFTLVACQPAKGASDAPPAPVVRPTEAFVVFRSVGATPQGATVHIMTDLRTGCEYLYVEMFQNGVTIVPSMERVPNEVVRTRQRGCRS